MIIRIKWISIKIANIRHKNNDSSQCIIQRTRHRSGRSRTAPQAPRDWSPHCPRRRRWCGRTRSYSITAACWAQNGIAWVHAQRGSQYLPPETRRRLQTRVIIIIMEVISYAPATFTSKCRDYYRICWWSRRIKWNYNWCGDKMTILWKLYIFIRYGSNRI